MSDPKRYGQLADNAILAMRQALDHISALQDPQARFYAYAFHMQNLAKIWGQPETAPPPGLPAPPRRTH